jgi:hypothetical protein
MSAILEQDLEELDYLNGARVIGMRIRSGDPAEYETDALVLTFQLAPKNAVEDGPSRGDIVEVEVWQDVEGNGPGYLALTGIKQSAKFRKAQRAGEV